MLGRRFSRPRHGTVVAYLALFVALGGGAYAVTTAPKNSVVSRSIQAGEVRTADIDAGAVTGSKLRAGAVGQAKLAKAEPWHEVGAPGQPQFLPDGGYVWKNYDAVHNSAGFYRDPYGRVHLKGLVCEHGVGTCSSGGSAVLIPIFQLPAGFHPAREIEFATSSQGLFARLDIKPDGTVSADPPFDVNSLYLDNISFRCAPSGASGCP